MLDAIRATVLFLQVRLTLILLLLVLHHPIVAGVLAEDEVGLQGAVGISTMTGTVTMIHVTEYQSVHHTDPAAGLLLGVKNAMSEKNVISIAETATTEGSQESMIHTLVLPVLRNPGYEH